MRFFALAFAVLTATPIGAQTPRPRSTAPAGKIDVQVVFDSSYGRSRKIWIYTPPGYDARATTPYPLVLAFDGDEYRADTMPLPHVLDSLLAAKKAPAFVAVLVDNAEGPTRIADLGNAPRMAEF